MNKYRYYVAFDETRQINFTDKHEAIEYARFLQENEYDDVTLYDVEKDTFLSFMKEN